MSPAGAGKRILHIFPVPTHPVLAGNCARVRRLAGDLRELGHELDGLRRRFSDLELLLAGPICRCPGLRPGPGVRLLGVLDDLAKLYEQVHVAVNPAFAGSGLHVKNLEAMGFGRPLVMTPGASRGIREGAGHAYRLARSARGFQREIAGLLTDRSAAERLAGGAHDFARACDERTRRQLAAILDHPRLEHHRPRDHPRLEHPRPRLVERA